MDLCNIKFEILCHEKTTLVIGTSENMDCDKNNLIIYDFETGEYENESFSPHKQQYVMFRVEKETIITYFVCHVNNPKQYVFEIFGKHFYVILCNSDCFRLCFFLDLI